MSLGARPILRHQVTLLHHRCPMSPDEALAGIILALICGAALAYALWRLA